MLQLGKNEQDSKFHVREEWQSAIPPSGSPQEYVWETEDQRRESFLEISGRVTYLVAPLPFLLHCPVRIV